MDLGNRVHSPERREHSFTVSPVETSSGRGRRTGQTGHPKLQGKPEGNGYHHRHHRHRFPAGFRARPAVHIILDIYETQGHERHQERDEGHLHLLRLEPRRIPRLPPHQR